MKVLFVCTGNICRSPTAEGVFAHMAHELGLEVVCDSAGTHGYHVGEPPDQRSTRAAGSRGYDISMLRARKICAEDFEVFDRIYALDSGHLAILNRVKPSGARAQVALFLTEAELDTIHGHDVPDPYYGEADGFLRVLSLMEEGCAKILARMAQKDAITT